MNDISSDIYITGMDSLVSSHENIYELTINLFDMSTQEREGNSN
jgi:hypothetical protein